MSDSHKEVAIAARLPPLPANPRPEISPKHQQTTNRRKWFKRAAMTGKVLHLGAHLLKGAIFHPSVDAIMDNMPEHHYNTIRHIARHLRKAVGLNHPASWGLHYGAMAFGRHHKSGGYMQGEPHPQNTQPTAVGAPKTNNPALPKPIKPHKPNTINQPVIPAPPKPQQPKQLTGPKPYVPPPLRPDLQNHVNTNYQRRQKKRPKIQTPEEIRQGLLKKFGHLLPKPNQ